MSVLANLDEDTCNFLIQRYRLDRDIRYVCPVLDIVYTSSNLLVFGEGNANTVKLFENEWSPLTYQESNNGPNGYLYSMKLIPSKSFVSIDQYYSNASALSNNIGIPLITPSVEFTIPTRGMNLVNLLTSYRKASMQEYWNDPKEAIFLYYENDIMITSTIGGLANNFSREFSLSADQLALSTYAYADARNQHKFELEQPPRKQSYSKKLESLFGRRVLLESPGMFIPGVAYSGVTNENWHPELKNLVCLSCTGCSDWQPNSFHTVFAELLV